MANATIIYACTGSGLAIFNKPGTLNEWLPPRVALDGAHVLSAWASAGPPIRLAAAVDEAPGAGELLISENGGRDWDSRLEAAVTAVLGFDDEPSRLYAGLEGGGIAGSTDGGLTWGVLPDTGAGIIHRMLAGPEKRQIYVLADVPLGGSILEGSPEEGTWKILPVNGAAALARDTDTGDLYAATSGGVQMSADLGTSWAVLPGSPEGGTSVAVIPGPKDGNPAILLGTSSGLFVSPDGGASWHPSNTPDEGVTDIVRDPERRDRAYLSTSKGFIFESGNRGQKWLPVNADPLSPITYLHILRF